MNESEKSKNAFVRVSEVLTSWPAVLLYSVAIACYDKRVSLPIYKEYSCLILLFGVAFWYAVFRMTVKSWIFALLIYLPLMLDFLVSDYAHVYFSTNIRTVMDTAFDATTEQVGMYTDSIFSFRVLLIILFTFSLPVMGRIAKVDRWKLRSFLLFVGVVVATLFFTKGPTRYLLSTCKKYDGQWHDWIGDSLFEPGLHKNQLFRKYTDKEHPEDVYIPFARTIWWYDVLMNHYFPVEYLDCAQAESTCVLEEGQKVNVVLYIVESFRRDHSPFHGYARNTLPLLSAHKGNIIALPCLTSFGTHSIQSLYGMLSDADEQERDARHTSFQAIFRKHGFNCVLIENNAHGAAWAPRSLFKTLLKDSYDSYILVKHDNNFPPITNKELAGHDRNMFIIYDGTSHYPFEAGANGRYGDTLLDRYDETRHTIDAAAASFVESLEDSPSIVLFVSDHGESFGEEGRLCHGGPLAAREQREIFGIIWYSDSYAEQFPEVIKTLKANAGLFVSHDNIFHTMPSMGGIHSALRKAEMDVTEPRPAPAEDAEPGISETAGQDITGGQGDACETDDASRQETP